MILNEVAQRPNFEKDWKENDHFRSNPFAEGQAMRWDLGIPALSSLLYHQEGVLCIPLHLEM